MIRPTENLSEINLTDPYSLVSPRDEYTTELATMFYESYSGSDRIGYPDTNTIERQTEAITSYFEHNKDDLLTKASCLVYDKATGTLIAACLISLWEDLPLVSNIAVLHTYRGKGIATFILRRAITTLYRNYDVVRLFVTSGNGAESVYYNLGFRPGMEQTSFYLPILSASS